jgi:hypothetical protein
MLYNTLYTLHTTHVTMAQPSLIPVPISKRTSASLHPSVLQQSTNSVNSAARSPSPLANSTTSTSKNNKRLSLANGHGLNGSTSSSSNGHSNGRKSSTEAEDPGTLLCSSITMKHHLHDSIAKGTNLEIGRSTSSSTCSYGRRLSCIRYRRVNVSIFAYFRFTITMDTYEWDFTTARNRPDAWRWK